MAPDPKNEIYETGARLYYSYVLCFDYLHDN